MSVAIQIQVLSNFLRGIDHDPRIRTTHIAAYMALYKCWIEAGQPEQLKVKASEIMEIAKISSSATWFRAINALNEYGYILYVPTYNKMRATTVSMSVGGADTAGGFKT